MHKLLEYQRVLLLFHFITAGQVLLAEVTVYLYNLTWHDGLKDISVGSNVFDLAFRFCKDVSKIILILLLCI